MHLPAPQRRKKNGKEWQFRVKIAHKIHDNILIFYEEFTKSIVRASTG